MLLTSFASLSMREFEAHTSGMAGYVDADYLPTMDLGSSYLPCERYFASRAQTHVPCQTAELLLRKEVDAA